MINVLFDQRVIPNYRVGIYKKLAAIPDISLTVSYWTTRSPDEPPHMGRNLGFDTVAFTPLRHRISGKDYWFNLDLCKYILRHRPDVVIGPIAMFGVNSVISKVTEVLLRFLIGTKFVYRVSFGLLPGVRPRVSPTGLRKLWYKLLYRNVVVTTYTQKAAEIARLQGCAPERILVDYNSMDSDKLLAIRSSLAGSEGVWESDFLQRYGIRNRGFVLFAGRISAKKRLDVLMEAWKLLLRSMPDVQLVVVGSGPDREQAMQQARDIADRVVFVEGIYDTEELAKFYYLAAIVVFPGYATLSTHFAMCFGKPIICSQYGNEAEYVRDGLNGLVYEYGDVADLAGKIIALLRDDGLRKRFSSGSERLVREVINIDHMIHTIASAIRQAAA